MDDERVRRLLDERAIRRCLSVYCHGADRGDVALAMSTYHPDATDARSGKAIPVEQVGENMSAGQLRQGQKQHVVSNMLVEITGDSAVAETYYLCYLEEPSSSGMIASILAGRYVDRLVRRDGVWGVAMRQVAGDWTRRLPDGEPWSGAAAFPTGSRDGTDPVATTLASLRGGPHAFGAGDRERGAGPDQESKESSVSLNEDVQRLVDEREITRCLYRYARSVDRRDFDSVVTCYHPGAYDEHGHAAGPIEEFVETLKDHAAGHGVKQHIIANVLIETAGDNAVSESYYLCYLEEVQPEGPPAPSILAGRYVDRFERRDGEWRIVHRIVVMDWSRQIGTAPEWSGHSSMRRGGAVSDDPADVAFRELRESASAIPS